MYEFPLVISRMKCIETERAGGDGKLLLVHLPEWEGTPAFPYPTSYSL